MIVRVRSVDHGYFPLPADIHHHDRARKAATWRLDATSYSRICSIAHAKGGNARNAKPISVATTVRCMSISSVLFYGRIEEVSGQRAQTTRATARLHQLELSFHRASSGKIWTHR